MTGSRCGSRAGWGFGWLVLVLAGAARLVAAEGGADALLNEFADHVRGSTGVEADARRNILESIERRGPDSDAESVLMEALALLSASFREGLDAFDRQDYPGCVAAMDRAAGDSDPYVRNNAAVHAIRALVQAGRLIEGEERIAAARERWEDIRRYTASAAELAYMHGYCQVQTLQYDQGRATLERFLADYPDAPEYLIVTARQTLAEIARRVPGSIGEVADLMDFARDRLAAADSSERVRQTQARIVELLDGIIQQAEQMEQQSQASGGAPPQARPQDRRPNQAEPPQQPGQGPRPESPGEPPARPGRRVQPGEAWGNMPPAEREKVLQFLRDGFPGRYRALVEQYYQSLAVEP